MLIPIAMTVLVDLAVVVVGLVGLAPGRLHPHWYSASRTSSPSDWRGT